MYIHMCVCPWLYKYAYMCVSSAASGYIYASVYVRQKEEVLTGAALTTQFNTLPHKKIKSWQERRSQAYARKALQHTATLQRTRTH